MKKLVFIQVLVGAIIFASLFACRSDNQKEKAKEELLGIPPVKVVQVMKQRISEKLYYTGTLEAWRKVNITPDIGGKVAQIHVEEGQRVRKGQLLAELDTQAVRLQLQQAEAASAAAEANLKNASRNKERMDRLYQEKAVSDQQYEQIKLAYEAAKAQFEQAQAALNLVRHSLEVSLMKAPFDGFVASKNAEVGDVINPMMGSFSPVSGVLTLMDFSRIKISVEVSQADIVRIKKGQRALLNTAYPGAKEYEGVVSVVNLTADPLSKKFKVEVTVRNADLALRPGTFGEVVFEISSSENALVIPQKAILDDRYVFQVQGNRARKKEVVLGLRNKELVEIKTGIQEGDLVVVEGNYGLIDGMEVEIKR
ncbi:MAG: efflux RND transporter periplasmic adaptor subunit [Candidatus Aminicenantales bacterium]